MRIIQVLHSHGFGGAEQHTLLLMKGLQKRGHEVLYAGPRDSWLAEQCQAHGIEVHHLRMAGMYDFFSYHSLKKLVRSWQADIVHGHLLRAARYVGASSGNAIPVCTAHATTARKHMGKCRHIIAVADAVRETLLKAGYPSEKISVIHNGVQDVMPGDRELLRKELGIPSDAFALFNAGRFIRDKGQDLLVRVLQQTPDVLLYLAGDDTTPFGKEVRRQVVDNDRIRFLGYRSDIQRLLSAFDIYVSASRREAFGLSLAEAFAAGLPVVATAVGGVPELVRHNVNGMLVQSENVEEFACAIKHLATDRSLLRSLGDTARKTFEEEFNSEVMIDRVEAIYRRLIS
jgi:glycosyltransferase involved in cell wall biosynthesis